MLDSGGYGLEEFRGAGTLAGAETLPLLPATGRMRPTRPRGTGPPSGCQSNYLSQSHTQLTENTPKPKLTAGIPVRQLLAINLQAMQNRRALKPKPPMVPWDVAPFVLSPAGNIVNPPRR